MTNRSDEEIIADPGASPEEIRSLSTMEQARHPNCPEARWWVLVGQYPIQGMLNPSFELFTLEDPARWEALQKLWIENWFENLNWASPLFGRFLSVYLRTCLERLLPLFTKYSSLALRFQEMMEVRIQDPTGPLPDLMYEIRDIEIKGSGPSREARIVAFDALREETLSRLLDRTCTALSWYSEIEVPNEARTISRFRMVEAQEQIWQWHTLIDFIRKYP